MEDMIYTQNPIRIKKTFFDGRHVYDVRIDGGDYNRMSYKQLIMVLNDMENFIKNHKVSLGDGMGER